MAFTTVDLAIQEILQTDFITDIASIHNSNVLLLKDKLEDLINNLEIDINNRKIGTDNAIESIKTDNLILQDDGFIYQTGVPNNIIASLSKNAFNESILRADILIVDSSMSVDVVNVNSLTVNTTLTTTGTANITGSLTLNSALVESKESVSVLAEFNGATKADAVITLNATSKNNIYVTIEAETAVGATRVWTGTAFSAGLASINLVVDFDITNPPAPNSTFNICIVDLIENSGNTSITSDANTATIPIKIVAGTNNNTTNTILMHSDFVAQGLSLGVNFSSANPLNQSIQPYGSNVEFNYIIDGLSNDRLIITSLVGLEVY